MESPYFPYWLAGFGFFGIMAVGCLAATRLGWKGFVGTWIGTLAMILLVFLLVVWTRGGPKSW